jgi:hypothetical protein
MGVDFKVLPLLQNEKLSENQLNVTDHVSNV